MAEKPRKGKEPKIAPEVYNAYLSGLVLGSVKMTSLKALMYSDPGHDDALDFSIDFKCADTTGPGAVGDIEFEAKFAIHIRDMEGEDVADIDATYVVSFFADEMPPKGFFEVFGPTNLSRLTYPFFREVVAGITAKMELPQLFVPLNVFGARPKAKGKSPKAAKGGKQGDG